MTFMVGCFVFSCELALNCVWIGRKLSEERKFTFLCVLFSKKVVGEIKKMNISESEI